MESVFLQNEDSKQKGKVVAVSGWSGGEVFVLDGTKIMKENNG